MRWQAGLNEVVAATLARVTEAQRQAMMRTGILLTGGCTNLSGFATRVELDVRMNRPTRYLPFLRIPRLGVVVRRLVTKRAMGWLRCTANHGK
jgi:actin-related protein